MARPTITTVQVRAKDIEPTDVIFVGGRWRTIYDLYRNEHEFAEVSGQAPERYHGRLETPTPRGKNGEYRLFDDEIRKTGALARAFDLFYTVIRVTHDETSDGGTFDDRYVIAGPYDLIDVQVENWPAEQG